MIIPSRYNILWLLCKSWAKYVYSRFVCARNDKIKKKLNKGDSCLLYFMFTHRLDICSKIIEIILLRRGWSYNIIFVINCVHILYSFIIFYISAILFSENLHASIRISFRNYNKLQCCRYIVGNIRVVFNSMFTKPSLFVHCIIILYNMFM